MRRSGFVMILALVFMVVLAAMVMALAYYISSETRGIGFQLDDTKALYLAQAGVERAFREIRDDFLTTLQQGVADLRGATTTGSSGVTNLARIRYINETGTPANNVATFTTGTAMLRAFDSNYVNTKVTSLQAAARAGYTGGTTGATSTVSYTTNNGSTWTALSPPATLTTTVTDYYWPMPTLPWATLMNTTSFRIRAQRTAGNSTVQLDALYLRVSYAVDTNTEQWYAGSYDTFPKSLGDGFIQSVSIVDEARKVHLNSVNLATPASSLLRYLMQERGIPAATASTLATAIGARRGNTTINNPFDSVEELQQVSGMTTAYYNLIKDYVTVYSFTNTYTQRPVGNPWYRAPVNINTAPPEVLEAIFDPILGTSLSATLASGIVTQRTTVAPFTCFYSSDSLVTTDFYDFVKSRTYAGFTDTLKNRVLDNADASTLVPVYGFGGYTGTTTEFCYANTTYKIESVGKITVPGQITSDINLRVKTIVGNDGSRTFQNFTGDTTSTGYWKENYE